MLEIEDFLEEGLNIIQTEIVNKENVKDRTQKVFPLLAVRNVVLFPKIIMPITAGRDQSIRLLQDAYKTDKLIAVVSQKNALDEELTFSSLNSHGCIGRVLKIINLPDGNITAIIKGTDRCKVNKILAEKPYLTSEITKLKDTKSKKDGQYFSALIENIKDISLKIIEHDPNIPNAASFAVKNVSEEVDLLNFICSNANFSTDTKHDLLKIKDLYERASKCYELLSEELQKIEIKNKIHQRTSRDLDRQQREYFLNQQIKTIQEELGGGTEGDADELRKKAESINWNEDVEKHFQKELTRLLRQNPNSPDYNVQRNYLDFFTDLPWENYSKDTFNLKKAQKILDKAHFGLEDVKKRILEHMSVLKLKNDMKSPIICLVGPPGVGKTSLGKSIADALNRKYLRISLGGVHDESEIRGHRKTYIGAMAGRILQAIKKVGTSNPVIVLDEIDKIGHSVHGDPSSALLEVLDPEQNNSFYDNFLEYGYDLSKTMFIATANSLSTIQRPLLDRMEIIEISGYTLEEKSEIAKRHLIEKQRKENGITSDLLKLGNNEINHIIDAHTSESGVRRLEKNIASIARWAAFQKAMEVDFNPKISIKKIDEILGVPRPKNFTETTNVPGVVTGLAWTSVGGDILFIESILSKGNGTTLSMTGNLGNVMKESATIALEYIKAMYEDLGITKEQIKDINIHIHVPEGATPKDGPSAGIAMLTSMVSSLTSRKVKQNIAMTGEITLRGKVLPVGGIKEKLLAASRAGISDVILCEVNRKDVEEIKKEYLKNLNIHYVTMMNDVINLALESNVIQPLKA